MQSGREGAWKERIRMDGGREEARVGCEVILARSSQEMCPTVHIV